MIIIMGNQRLYCPEGGFSAYLYHQVGETLVAPNGVEGKIVEKIDARNAFDGLPTLSNTSEVYLKQNMNGEIVQARIYSNRMPMADFDWDHSHINANGQHFEAGVVHVQPWKQNADGKWVRDSKHARYLTEKEVERYGPLLRKINPNLKFRP